MGQAWITAAFGILGVVVGGLIQYLLAQALAKKKILMSETSRAYADFVSESASHGISEEFSEFSKAKSLVAIYGSDEVVKYLAEFNHEHVDTTKPENMIELMRLVRRMRKDLYGKDKVTDEDISKIIVGRTLPS